MIFREAEKRDISDMMEVRMSVRENVLQTPGLVTPEITADFILRRGKGWVCEVNGSVIGFSIADLEEKNIWALFVKPGYEGKGIGRKLHELMMDWYFTKTRDTAWLGTAPETRAESFYSRAGWKRAGIVHQGEVKFEMTYGSWKSLKG